MKYGDTSDVVKTPLGFAVRGFQNQGFVLLVMQTGTLAKQNGENTTEFIEWFSHGLNIYKIMYVKACLAHMSWVPP